MFNFGKGKSSIDAPLSLEDARFSSEDLFGLIGGYDNFALTAGQKLLAYQDEELATFKDNWRKTALTRLIGTGLLTDEGQPSVELATALEPLNAAGWAVSNGAAPGSSHAAALFTHNNNWTIVRKAPGFYAGWVLTKVDPNLGIDAAICNLLGAPEPCHSEWTGEGYVKADERDVLISAVNEGNQEALDQLSAKRSLPRGPLFDLANSYGRGFKNPKVYEIKVRDYSGCEMAHMAVTVPATSKGVVRTAHATVVPSKGFYMTLATVAKESDDPSIIENVKLIRQRKFCRVGFVNDGPFFDKALAMPRFYPDGILPAY